MTGLVREARTLAIRAEHGGAVGAVLASVVAVAVVTGVALLLREIVPALSLGALYVLAVLGVAVVCGPAYAALVAVASMLTFNFVFVPPTLSFTLHGGENWLVLGIYVITGLIVGDLARRARRTAREAEQREREASFLAELSSTLLAGADLTGMLPRVAADTGRILDLTSARIGLGGAPVPRPGEVAIELDGGEKPIATLYALREEAAGLNGQTRFLVALASVLGIALDRERLAHEALEAEALRRSDALKTALLRTVSHDLRSPLTAIRAALEALDSPDLVLDACERTTLLRSALAEAIRLDRTVRNLLDLSRLQAGATRPRPRLSTLEGLLDQALAHFPGTRGGFEVRIEDALPLVEADPVQIEHALVNLLENALKFSPAAAPISIDVKRAPGEVVVRIVDRGPGFSADDVERVFEPFAQGSTPRDGAGTGLGLAIARGFVETNGGRLWAEPNLGGGGRLVLTLPAALDPVWAEA